MVDNEEKNPTAYSFNFSMDSVKRAIVKCFSDRQYCGYDLHDFTSPFLKDIEDNHQQSDHDFLLMTFSWWDTECRSRVYFNKKGAPYLYFAKYHLHLSETEKGVNIKIYTIDPQIYIGRQPLPNPAFLTRGPKFKAVSNTTVEEYKILLMIGNVLKMNDMPTLKVPKPITIR